MRLLLTFSFLGLFAACGGSAKENNDLSTHDASVTHDASTTCPADISSLDGKPCSVEGQSCGTCADPCQFCNLVQCQGGTWQAVEAFPMQCTDGGDADGGN